MSAVQGELKFANVKLALKEVYKGGSFADKLCGNGYGTNEDSVAPFFYAHMRDCKCYSSSKASSASLCDSTFSDGKRVCCCAAPGEDRGTMCPVSAMDCGTTQMHTYTGVQGGQSGSVETSDAGANSAIFTITNSGSGAYTFVVTTPGSNYDSDASTGDLTADKIVVLGSTLGGIDGVNDATLAVSPITATFASLNHAATGVTEFSASGAGSATVAVSNGGSGAYSFTVTAAGTGYVPGDTITILGSALGGSDTTNDAVITATADGMFVGTITGTPAALAATGSTTLSTANVKITGTPVAAGAMTMWDPPTARCIATSAECSAGGWKDTSGVNPKCLSCGVVDPSSPAGTNTAAACVCSSGFWNNPLAVGAACVKCGPNEWSPAGSTSLSACVCAAGYWYSPTAFSNCAPCSAARYSATPGLTSNDDCLGCPSGRYGDGDTHTGKTSPSSACGGMCPKGRHGTQIAAPSEAECDDCEAGRFANYAGAADICLGMCSAGRFAPQTGLTTDAACMECPFRTVALPGSSACTPCTGVTFADKGRATCIQCGAKLFHAHPHDEFCTTCPPIGAQCLDSQITILKDYWLMPPFNTSSFRITADTILYKCTISGACLEPEPGKSIVHCAVSQGYGGVLCGECDRDNVQGYGHFTRSGKGCAKCWKPWQSWLAVLGLVGGLVAFMTYLVTRHDFNVPKGEYGTTIQKMTFSYLQMLGMLGIFKAKGTDVYNEIASRPAQVVGGSITSLHPLKCALHSQIYGPFLLTMTLPLLLLAIASVVLLIMNAIEKAIRKGRENQDVPTFKGRFDMPRFMAYHTNLRLAMTPADEAEWRDKFHPTQRFIGVLLFIFFSLYPSLVASIASMFNCTDPIEGVAYLVQDLTVQCYVGVHLAFLVFAYIGAAVYAVGIPVAVASAMTFHFPLRCADRKLKWQWERRSSEEYDTQSIRSRFGFLFNGFSTDRGAVVVAWEALVMLRKLAVTLAGSVIKDPYLQILVALLILVVSCVATAFVQPYETGWLNLLDTLGLFALILTQIFSIMYFYLESASVPLADPKTIEIAVTSMLLAVNMFVLLVSAGLALFEYAGMRNVWYKLRRNILKVASTPDTQMALAAPENRVEGHVWAHPSRVTVTTPPMQIAGGIWIWNSDEAPIAASTDDPELLIHAATMKEVPAGTFFRYVLPETRKLSVKQSKPRNIGGLSSDSIVEEVDVGNGVQLLNMMNAHARGAGNALAVPIAEQLAEREARVLSFEEELAAQQAVVEAKQAEIDAVKAEIAELHVAQPGAAPNVEGAAVAADEIEIAIIPSGEVVANAIEESGRDHNEEINPADECWYYPDADDVTHGPFSLTQMHTWSIEGHFENDHELHKGDEGGTHILLIDALRKAGLVHEALAVTTTSAKHWYYEDWDTPGTFQGPYSLAELKDWHTEGHFYDDREIRVGESGKPIKLGDALRDAVFEVV